MLDQGPSQLLLLLAGSVGAEELEHSCQIMNRDFFSFGAKLEHKNANISHRTQCACFTCGTLLHGYSANPCRIFVSHRCETAFILLVHEEDPAPAGEDDGRMIPASRED